MPRRKLILATGETYHILNRSVANIPIFQKQRECKVFIELLNYYRWQDARNKFSVFKNDPQRLKLAKKGTLVTILNYCLMPNHFHLTLRQETENGIKAFIQKVSNSFSHFYNKKFNNTGPLFQSSFKAILIENEVQLLHLSRYIHLNPVSAGIVENPEDYIFSSYRYYIGVEKRDFVDSKPILSQFSSLEKYKKFVLSRRDYQRKISVVKKIALEKTARPSFIRSRIG